MLLIERGEGVETKPIKTSYSASAGTAYVTFENASFSILSPRGNRLMHFTLPILGQGAC